MNKITATFIRVLLALGIIIHLPDKVKGQEGADFLNLNKPERVEWLQDAGFGMFIHFSFDSQLGMVISHSMVGASDDYLNRFIYDLPTTFNPARFSGDELAILAKVCGMKYMVLTAKHHSGFCFWDTQTTSFNIMKTPYNKDLVREYVEGCRRQGLAVGLYFSPEDFIFLHSNGQVITRDLSQPVSPDIMAKYLDYTERQLTELLTNYGKIDVIFFDGGEGPLQEKAKEVAWKLQPDILITRGAISTPEQFIPGTASDEAWEACVTMGTQWQYKPTNEDYKSGGKLIEILIESRAKGGALLLNVGPKPDGQLPIEQEERLRELGAWMFINQEAIYGVRPWVVTNEQDIWFTASKDRNTLYAHIPQNPLWPRGQRREFILRTVTATPGTRVSVLGQSDAVVEYKPGVDARSRFVQEGGGIRISVVRAQRIYNDHNWPNPVVVKLENIKPVVGLPSVRTLPATISGKKVIFSGETSKDDNSKSLEYAFAYRPYGGFTEYLQAGGWSYTTFSPMGRKPVFEFEMKGLTPGVEYEYRAVIRRQSLIVHGDIERMVAP